MPPNLYSYNYWNVLRKSALMKLIVSDALIELWIATYQAELR